LQKGSGRVIKEQSSCLPFPGKNFHEENLQEELPTTQPSKIVSGLQWLAVSINCPILSICHIGFLLYDNSNL